MGKEILVVAEHGGGALRPESLEAAACGRELAELTGGSVTGVVLSAPGLPPAGEFAARAGIEVVALTHPELDLYNAEAYLSALAALMNERRPAYVLIPHTATGWDYAARLAVRTGASYLAAVTAIMAGDPPAFTRSICHGKIAMEVMPAEGTAVVTVMPGAFANSMVATKVAPTDEEIGGVERLEAAVDLRGTRARGYVEAKRRALDLGQAEVIVAAGRGVEKPENLGLIRELAACFERGAVGASRPLVDMGWLPLDHQVGQTGQTVAPRLYLACGISGAIQHTAGMKNSELIVAINLDPGAMIFDVARLGVVADLVEFIPALIGKLRR
ncbi:MAG TPA: electron transfer flavoprotein subunit alpha/FixB family protein [bacterium]|nr:electron transfer flavoprotein subunit alpha/FixB family protein [bacterium]